MNLLIMKIGLGFLVFFNFSIANEVHELESLFELEFGDYQSQNEGCDFALVGWVEDELSSDFILLMGQDAFRNIQTKCEVEIGRNTTCIEGNRLIRLNYYNQKVFKTLINRISKNKFELINFVDGIQKSKCIYKKGL